MPQLPPMPTDTGFRVQVIVTVLVAVAVIWVGVQTGDWTGLVLLVPLLILIPVVAKLPAEPPKRRKQNATGPDGSPTPGATGSQKDRGDRRY
jgi:hypothetical protein